MAQVAGDCQSDASHEARVAQAHGGLQYAYDEQAGNIHGEKPETLTGGGAVYQCLNEQGDRQVEEAGQRGQPESQNDAALVWGREGAQTRGGSHVYRLVAVDRRVPWSIGAPVSL